MAILETMTKNLAENLRLTDRYELEEIAQLAEILMGIREGVIGYSASTPFEQSKNRLRVLVIPTIPLDEYRRAHMEVWVEYSPYPLPANFLVEPMTAVMLAQVSGIDVLLLEGEVRAALQREFRKRINLEDLLNYARNESVRPDPMREPEIL